MKVALRGHYGYGRLVKSMLPSMGMMLVISAYSMADGFFISNFAGSTAFAAMNIIWPGIQLLSAIGLMIGSGGSALVSKILGEGEQDKACRIFTALVRFAFLLGLGLAVAAFVWMKPLVISLGAEAEMIPLAVAYGRIVVVPLPLFVLHLVFEPFYMTAERPALGMRYSVVCGLANVGLDALFVCGFGWGLTGAAVATAVTLAVGGLLPFLWFAGRRNTTHLRFVSEAGGAWRAIAKACTNGLSEYVGNVALSVVSIVYNLQLMKYVGANGVSAYGVLMYIGFLFAAVFIGYNVGVSQVIAYHYGAGDQMELRSLLCKSLVLIGLGGVLLTLLAELAAVPVVKCIVGYDDELCALTVRALRIYMLSFLLCGFNMFASAWFTALNNGLVSAVVAFARTLVFELGCVLIFPVLMGVDGIWSAVNFAELLAFALSAVLVWTYRKRYGYALRHPA